MCTKFEGRSFIRLRNIGTFLCGTLIDPVTLTFDLLTLKSVWESHVTWGTPVQSFVFLDLLVFELEPMYATSDRQTDGQTDDGRRSSLNAPAPSTVGGIISIAACNCKPDTDITIGSICESVSCSEQLALEGVLGRSTVYVCFSQPSIYIDGWLYGMRMTSVTFRCCIKTIPHIIILSSRHESDIPSLPGRQVSSS